jgi:hypothetical protein
MSEPQYLSGDPVALGTEVDDDQEEIDFWDAVDDAYDLAMEK